MNIIASIFLLFPSMGCDQGDKIGQIFAYWAMYCFLWEVFEIYKISRNCWISHFRGKSSLLILTKKLLGYIFVDFLQLVLSPWLWRFFCSQCEITLKTFRGQCYNIYYGRFWPVFVEKKNNVMIAFSAPLAIF
jgi:hypothetical protein